MNSRQNGRLYRSLQAMSIIPLLILGVIIALSGYRAVGSAVHAQVRTELKNMTDAVILTYDMLYPGQYDSEGTDSISLFKGGQDISADYSVIDGLKDDTRIDITVFYQDTRILTTLGASTSSRHVGTVADSRVVSDVLLTGQNRFYTNILADGQRYCAYYTPLRNPDGTIVGMVCAGRPRAEVSAAIRDAALPIFLVALCSMTAASVISFTYTRRLISALQKIRDFLSKVSIGNLGEELDPDVLRRNDELSEIGYSALYMQRSLRNLVEQDTLTELHNRRFADKRLKQTQMQANIHGTKFVVVIGDIDFFKSVNDTYGHECGDLVLKKVAVTLKKNMLGKGFAARWGGEEFLFVYDNMDLASAAEETEALLEDIRRLAVTYDDQTVRITMTFGLAEGSVNTSIKDLLQEADSKLYEGKANGRNRVVF